ncbi:MAG: hypothetical protein IKG21_11375 [Atopobiaceae bacterium]|nr:hypothetical protein [Atopobiaceae bacterium]
MHAIEFLLIFAAALVLYGLVMWRTGNVDLMPYHATYSISSKDDVRRVGLIVARVGLVLGAVLCAALMLMLLGA